MDAAERERVARRLMTACEMFELGCAIMKQNLERQHPDQSAEQLAELFVAWLRHRPGAEHGDAVGRAIAWPRAEAPRAP